VTGSLFSHEHYALMAQFEQQFKGKRLDREDKSYWPKGIIYQDGAVNELFLAFRRGAAYGEAIVRAAASIGKEMGK
jgi:uncharacterized membrane protein